MLEDNEFFQFINQVKKQIDKTIIKQLTIYKPLLNESGTLGADLYKKLLTHTIKGKSVRGALSIFVAQAFGKEHSPALFEVAAIIELAEYGLLIHDDVMDKDLKRRGLPTLHTDYKKLFTGKNAEHNGNALAICAGDVLFFMVLNTLSQIQTLPDKTKTHLASYISNYLLQTGVAQMDDIFFSNTKNVPTKDEILNLYVHKTARYTFVMPLVIGSVLAGEESYGNTLHKLGDSLGILYQIRDDELELSGTRISTDITEQKLTLPFVLLSRKAPKKELTKLQKQIHNPKQLLLQYKQLLALYDIDTELEELKRKARQESLSLISSLPLSPQYMRMFTDMVYFLSDRTR
jgi:geranylgeranyl pyrophosphate synthase